MKQILAILEDPEQRKLFHWLCEQGGARPHMSDGALHALTELERTEVDAVVCSQNTGDMTGEEFRNIVRYEPATRLTPFYLLWEDMPEHMGVPPNYDLPASQTLLQTTRDVLERLEVELPDDARLLRSSPSSKSGDLNGDFEGVTLSELLNWVAEMEHDGHWVVWPQAASPGAHLLVQGGNVVYAEYGPWLGRDAVLELLDMTHQQPEIPFSFFQSALPSGPIPKNISERTERLLMEIMVDFDHRQAERQGIDTSQIE